MNEKNANDMANRYKTEMMSYYNRSRKPAAQSSVSSRTSSSSMMPAENYASKGNSAGENILGSERGAAEPHNHFYRSSEPAPRPARPTPPPDAQSAESVRRPERPPLPSVKVPGSQSQRPGASPAVVSPSGTGPAATPPVIRPPAASVPPVQVERPAVRPPVSTPPAAPAPAVRPPVSTPPAAPAPAVRPPVSTPPAAPAPAVRPPVSTPPTPSAPAVRPPVIAVPPVARPQPGAICLPKVPAPTRPALITPSGVPLPDVSCKPCAGSETDVQPSRFKEPSKNTLNCVPPVPSSVPDYTSAEEGRSLQAGYLKVEVATGNSALPIKDAAVIVSRQDGDRHHLVKLMLSDISGNTPVIGLYIPPEFAVDPVDEQPPFNDYMVSVYANGFYAVKDINIPIFPGIKSIQSIQLIPLAEFDEEFTVIPYLDAGRQ